MSVATERRRPSTTEGWYQKADEEFIAMAFSDELRTKAIRELEVRRWYQHWFSIGLSVATGIISFGTLMAMNLSDRQHSPQDILPLFISWVVTMGMFYQLIHCDSKVRLLKLIGRMQDQVGP